MWQVLALCWLLGSAVLEFLRPRQFSRVTGQCWPGGLAVPVLRSLSVHQRQDQVRAVAAGSSRYHLTSDALCECASSKKTTSCYCWSPRSFRSDCNKDPHGID
jgi:hypothetical protein